MSSSSDIRRLLLDTNAFLYFINNDSALSGTAKDLLESEVDLLISAASLWEIAIKFSIGKLSLLIRSEILFRRKFSKMTSKFYL